MNNPLVQDVKNTMSMQWYAAHAMVEKSGPLLSSLKDKGAFKKGLWHNYIALLENGTKSYRTAFDPITQKKLLNDNQTSILMANEHSADFHNNLSQILLGFLADNKSQIRSVCQGRNQEKAFDQALQAVLGTALLNGMQYEFNQIASCMIECHPNGKPFLDPMVNRAIMVPAHILEQTPDRVNNARQFDKRVHPMYLAAMCCYEKCMDKMIEGGWSAEHSSYISEIERNPEIPADQAPISTKTFMEISLQIEGDLMPSVVQKIFETIEYEKGRSTPKVIATAERTSDWLENKIQSTLPIESDMVNIGLHFGFQNNTPMEHLISASITPHAQVIAACKDAVDWTQFTSENHPINKHMESCEWESDYGTPLKPYEESAKEILKHMLANGLADQLKLENGIVARDPLRYFVEQNQEEPMILCLKMGLDPEFKSPDGKSALSEAQKTGNKEILEVLRTHKTANTAMSILDEILRDPEATIHP